MLATSAGIGLFLAFIGLQSTQGLGLAVFSPTTVVTLGACRRGLCPHTGGGKVFSAKAAGQNSTMALGMNPLYEGTGSSLL